jgi:hypothetical protein
LLDGICEASGHPRVLEKAAFLSASFYLRFIPTFNFYSVGIDSRERELGSIYRAAASSISWEELEGITHERSHGLFGTVLGFP